TPPASMSPSVAGTGATTSGSAGSSAQPTAPGTPAVTPPPAAGGAAPDAGVCEGATAPLAASAVAPSNLLFVLDRSVEMAGNFQGAPRWQLASQALSHTVSARAKNLTLGAVLYPSAAAPCSGPDWLCTLQQPAMCSVNPMASNDQLAFQPAAQALSVLVGTSGIYAPVMSAGVPLAESLQRADAALASSTLSGSTAVVIVATGMPSCEWNAVQAHDTIARWKSRGVATYVVTLPGSPATTTQALASLAEAGGTGRVRAPSGAGALEATLQSIVFNSFSSCVLELDPPAPDPNAVQLLVTQAGIERLLPRTGPSGEPQWTISADGKTVTLLGGTCDAAKRGDYDALRVVLSCAR
ncbi:MAG TPA: hypothetical protein VJR89_12920, partial [Polyangiales bacterium]|nr:hypothetical protein [Polyangiales bacterium]